MKTPTMQESFVQIFKKSLFSHIPFLPEIRSISSPSKILFKSKDDAHYVAPGTKEGFERARQKKIFCPKDKEKRFGLPKYDFPDSTLYQTPGSHRILQKIPQAIREDDSEEKLGGRRRGCRKREEYTGRPPFVKKGWPGDNW